MQSQIRYEVLEGLPAYGPMYVSISETGEPFFSEGFVVRFYKSDGTDWVANFKPGWSGFNMVVDFPEVNRIIVIAKGQGYVISPEQQKPIETFGIAVKHSLRSETGEIVFADDDVVWVIEKEGTIWMSERISWDGIADLKFKNNILTGLTFDPMDNNEEWYPFTIDLLTKEITGGSYRRYPPVFPKP